jgi:hypothetical protein
MFFERCHSNNLETFRLARKAFVALIVLLAFCRHLLLALQSLFIVSFHIWLEQNGPNKCAPVQKSGKLQSPYLDHP